MLGRTTLYKDFTAYPLEYTAALFDHGGKDIASLSQIYPFVMHDLHLSVTASEDSLIVEWADLVSIEA